MVYLDFLTMFGVSDFFSFCTPPVDIYGLLLLKPISQNRLIQFSKIVFKYIQNSVGFGMGMDIHVMVN